MNWLNLPPPDKSTPPAFTDPLNGKIWLADQPQAHPLRTAEALIRQIRAIDAALMPPEQALELLNVLRSAVIPLQAVLEPRFLRKALPMLPEDAKVFEVTQQLWWQLAIAYYRKSLELPTDIQIVALQTAAIAIRMVEFCHLEAACDIPVEVDHLLFAILGQAHAKGLLMATVRDADFPHFGDSTLAGHLAWTFLLRLIEPYQLSAAQLTVANRALSRWRELCEFRTTPAADPKAHCIDVSPLFEGASFPPDLPAWIEIRKVVHKLNSRIKALQDGETPESLKLGRELSTSASIRLLKHMDRALSRQARPMSTEVGEVEVAFGCEHAYGVFKGETLGSLSTFAGTASKVSHQRLELFGFDQVSHAPGMQKRLSVPSENWLMVDGQAVRAANAQGERRLAPCLVASRRKDKPRLGIIHGLRLGGDNALIAELEWFEEKVEAGSFKGHNGSSPTLVNIPLFLLHDGKELSIIVPATANLRLETPLLCIGLPVARVTPTAVLDRGSDFVRYKVLAK